MKSGTRRMWSRRVLRAGWMIAPVFSFPRRLYKFALCDSDGKFSLACLAFVLFISTAFSGMVFMFHAIATEHRPASAERIAEARGEDACMNEYLPRIAANKGAEPLTNLDVDHAQRQCDKVARDYYAKLEQEKALGGKK